MDKNQMFNAIKVINVSKNFATSRLLWQKKMVTADLCNVPLEVEVKEGECFALLGPKRRVKDYFNKNTMLSILPDEGDIKIAGYNLGTQEELAKSKISLVTGEERSL